MMIARWEIEARFGHKETAIALFRSWFDEVGAQIGWTKENTRFLTGSVGAAESVLVSEHEIEDLAALQAAWEKLATIGAHADWSKKLEPYVVSGTNRWTVYRVL